MARAGRVALRAMSVKFVFRDVVVLRAIFFSAALRAVVADFVLRAVVAVRAVLRDDVVRDTVLLAVVRDVMFGATDAFLLERDVVLFVVSRVGEFVERTAASALPIHINSVATRYNILVIRNIYVHVIKKHSCKQEK